MDTQSKKVSVTGNATFTWISTGNSWQETFTYALAFDDNYKLIVYEVWADSGAAYLASRGELTWKKRKEESDFITRECGPTLVSYTKLYGKNIIHLVLVPSTSSVP